ncbi:SDR family NAD(P)-dependent oxidoreductase [Microbacterium sp. ET2]|uniref:SDR family NAD(P)-dependent oxidoreductase n=1 Tax=Microbacterium albipurpureum TaxID=3050384 RepID=UPI00259D0436|nr:SDR family NAD(P)-dependent oxidoreductase [Microbacterium sp. ET2 (Ac-2212)]WJL94658.1 SDR family NAD(P)-dependent oxidoreductase [Microbacterium sp. ET2 (Ac-2212)]
MSYPVDRPAVWFVTGASRGLGLALVRHLLASGGRVAATSRSAERLRTSLSDLDSDRLLALEVDLVDQDAVAHAVSQTLEVFGHLDVVVNNAGYGFLGAVEETTDADVRAMLDVQVNGTWNVLRAVLPAMRAERSGHILNISSILGLLAFPGWGLYCAGKFALEGMSEALAAEVADFGIRVTIVEPGYFDTDFLTSRSLQQAEHPIDAYPAIRDMIATHQAMPGTQLGDPARAAAAIQTIAERGDGPLRQQLGTDSSGFARDRAASLAAEIEIARELAVTTDYVRS